MSDDDRAEIGTVEVLRARVYPLRDEEQRDAWVDPGVYPLYLDDDLIYWGMPGRVAVPHPPQFEPLGGGLFVGAGGGHEVLDEAVDVRSGSFTREDFRAFLDHPGCTEGHPEQRLRIRVTAEV